MNAGLYATLGFGWAAFNACTPDIKDRLQAADWALSSVFLCSSLGSAATLFRMSSVLHDRMGPRACTAASTAVFGLGVAASGWNTHWPLAAASQLLTGAATGLMSVSISCTSMALEQHTPVMGRTEAMYSVGALGGALAVEAALEAGVPMPAVLTGAGGIVVAMAALSSCFASAEAATGGPSPQRQRADSSILWLSGISAVSNLAEGGISKWLSVYLAADLEASKKVARGGYIGVTAAAIVGRLLADRFWSEATVPDLAVLGGLVSGISFGMGLWRNDGASVIIGAAVAMLGLCTFSPAVKRQVKKSYPPSQWPAATSWVGGAKNLGSIAGSPLIGFLASQYGLRAGLSLIVAEGFLKAAMAPALRTALSRGESRQAEAAAQARLLPAEG